MCAVARYRPTESSEAASFHAPLLPSFEIHVRSKAKYCLVNKHGSPARETRE